MPLKKAKTSSLPYTKLPKAHNRTEAKVDSLVAERLTKIHKHKNWALEVKVAPNKLLPHQRAALKQVEDGRFKPYKIPDQGQRNPFDFIYIGDADAIVCTVDGKNVHCEVNGGVAKYNFRI